MFSPLTVFLNPSDQMNSRQKVEASLRQLERERALLQHQSADNLRKVEFESDRKRGLENECKHEGENLCPTIHPSIIYNAHLNLGRPESPMSICV